MTRAWFGQWVRHDRPTATMLSRPLVVDDFPLQNQLPPNQIKDQEPINPIQGLLGLGTVIADDRYVAAQ